MTLNAILLVGRLSLRKGADKRTLLILGEPHSQRQFRVLLRLRPESIPLSPNNSLPWCPP
jgi:molybdopterin-guanine dinucleotide biosynthesis protein A